MAWVAHTERVKSRKAREITIQLKRGKKDTRARLMIYFCKAAMDRTKWKAKEPIGLLLGDGEDKSKIRVIRINGQDNAPPAISFVSRALKGSARVDFGFVEKFGSNSRSTCEAKQVDFIDENTIEITLPDDEEWEEVKTKIEIKKLEEVPVAKSLPQVDFSNNIYRSSRNIIICTGKDTEAITFKGQSIDLTLKQAILLEALERTAPEPCDRAFIIKKIFGNNPPPTANDVLRTMISSLALELAKIKLRIRPIGTRPSMPDSYILEIV